MRLAKIVAVVMAMGISLNACSSPSSNVENDIGAIVFAPIAAPIGLTMRAIFRAFRSLEPDTDEAEAEPGVAEPPSAELRARLKHVVLHVRSEIQQNTAAASAAHSTNEAVEKPADANPAVHSQEWIKFNIALETALRDRLERSIPQKSAAKIVEDKEPMSSRKQSGPPDKAPIILIIRIDKFNIGRKDAKSSDLMLKLGVYAEVYGEPGVGYLYGSSWSLHAKAGAAKASTESGAIDLQEGTDAALDTMVAAIVDDLFLNTNSRPVSYKEKEGKVARGPTINQDVRENVAELQDLMHKAACGNAEAQLNLGIQLANVSSGIYRWRARKSWIEGYKWLRLAQVAGNDAAAMGPNDLKEKLTAEEIASAAELVAKFKPLECGEESDEKAQTTRIASSDPAAATQRGSSQSSIATPLAHARNNPPRKSREEIERYWRERIEAVKREGPHKDCELVVDSPSMNPADFSTCEERAETIERLQKERARELAS